VRRSSGWHAIIALLVVVSLAVPFDTAFCNRRVKVRVTNQKLVIVPVKINGQGPYDFLLDTGSTTTIVRPELISRLQGKPIGTSEFLTGAQNHWVTRYRFKSLGLDGAEIGPVGVTGFSLDGQASFDFDGILGQDILHFYNYLLDYRKKLIEVDEDNSLAASLSSITLPLVETEERLVVVVAPVSKRKKSALFILDSGANCLVLFRRDYEDYGLSAVLRDGMEVQTTAGGILVQAGVAGSFRIGGKEISSVPVTLLPATPHAADRPELGAFPLKWFHSVYINHTSHFVAFEPQFKLSVRTQARLK
jgi:predicted aspartyl protease